jgi:hypothetical protein
MAPDPHVVANFNGKKNVSVTELSSYRVVAYGGDGHMGGDENIVADHYPTMAPDMQESGDVNAVAQAYFVSAKQHHWTMALEIFPYVCQSAEPDSAQCTMEKLP